MTLRSIFLDPPQPERSARFRYGLLAVTGFFLAGTVYDFVTRPPDHHGNPFGSVIIAVMLLFNHVAFQFYLPPRLTAFSRILAIVWIVFAGVYIGYLSDVLYPR